MQRNKGKKFFETVIKWFQENGRKFTWREEGCSPYEILISEILLRRSMAERVQTVLKRLMMKYPSSSELVKAKPRDVIKIISTLGLENRYKTLIEAAKYINGSHEYTFETIRSIKGVGNYISGAFMISYKGENVPIIDSNIRRIFTRYFKTKSDDEISTLLRKIVTKKVREFYYGLIDLGSLICKPRPSCDKCPLEESCSYKIDVSN